MRDSRSTNTHVATLFPTIVDFTNMFAILMAWSAPKAYAG